jgi:toxin ParE1/3/4
MSKPVLQRPRADQDIEEIFTYLCGDSAKAANKFLDSVQFAYELLSAQSAIGSTRRAEHCPELPHPLRFHPIQNFPRILVYYMDRPDAVEVIRVWDAALGLDALMLDIAEPSPESN